MQSKQCKRKMILSYFDHDVPDPAHMCCDFHSHQCSCDDCEFAQALAVIEVETPQEQPSAVYLLQDKSDEELRKLPLMLKSRPKSKWTLFNTESTCNENCEGVL